MKSCKLWKVTLTCLYPNDNRESKVFWAYHFDEVNARDAALRWGEAETGGSAVVSISSVDLIK